MRFAEFHEQEFEGFLYSQLERSDRRLWHPHEVLEQYLGFDRGLFLIDQYLWEVKRHARPLRGIAPYYFYDLWPGLRDAGVARSRLPRFRLNCFLQAKRPEFGARVPRIASTLGTRRPVYRFSIEDEQQATLERFAAQIADRAIVSYAAPVFHRSQDLFAHGVRGTIVENTTFPDVAEMAGHERWYYNEPGATGIRNPDSTPVSFRPLSDRLNALAASVGDVRSQSQELASLAVSLRRALLAENASPTARAAYLAEEWRSIDAFCDATEAPDAVRGFLVVDAFCRTYRLRWLAVSEQPA